MKKIVKKMLSLLAVSVLAVSLAACSDKGTETTSTTVETTQQNTTEAPTETETTSESEPAEKGAVKIAFTAEDGRIMNLYENGKLYLMEGSEYETEMGWSLNDSTGLIEFAIPAGMESYVSLKFNTANGKAKILSNAVMDGEMTYALTLKEYKDIFGLAPSEVLYAENENGSIKIYDIGTYEMSSSGTQSEGIVEFTTADAATTASFVLKGNDGKESIGEQGEYSDTWTIEGIAVANARLKYALGYSIGQFTDNGMELYFWPDNTFTFVTEGSAGLLEIPGSYVFGNTDIFNLTLEMTGLGGAYGPVIVSDYDSDHDVFNFSVTPFMSETTYTMNANGTDINDALKDFVPSAVLYEVIGTEAYKGDTEIEDPETIRLVIRQGGNCTLIYDKFSLVEIGSGPWQYTNEEGFGFMVSGTYCSFGTGGLNETNKTFSLDINDMSSLTKVVFTLPDAEWDNFVTALTSQ